MARDTSDQKEEVQEICEVFEQRIKPNKWGVDLKDESVLHSNEDIHNGLQEQLNEFISCIEEQASDSNEVTGVDYDGIVEDGINVIIGEIDRAIGQLKNSQKVSAMGADKYKIIEYLDNSTEHLNEAIRYVNQIEERFNELEESKNNSVAEICSETVDVIIEVTEFVKQLRSEIDNNNRL